MFIETIVHDAQSSAGRLIRNKQFALLQCDHCAVRWEVVKPGKYKKKLRHYCSRQCTGMHIDRRKRIRESNLVAYNDRRDEILEKIKQTVHKNHGVEYFSQAQAWRDVMRDNQIDRVRKCHQTMKKNGTYRKSSIEDECFVWLVKNFGIEDIIRQATVPNHRWAFDFYVKSLDCYIQIDGVYWHGLDRKIDHSNLSRRDLVILRKMKTDQEQNSWAVTSEKRLCRVTDQELHKLGMDIAMKKMLDI